MILSVIVWSLDGALENLRRAHHYDIGINFVTSNESSSKRVHFLIIRLPLGNLLGSFEFGLFLLKKMRAIRVNRLPYQNRGETHESLPSTGFDTDRL